MYCCKQEMRFREFKESPSHHYQLYFPAFEQPLWERHGLAKSFEPPPIGRGEGIDVDLVYDTSINVHLKVDVTNLMDTSTSPCTSRYGDWAKVPLFA